MCRWITYTLIHLHQTAERAFCKAVPWQRGTNENTNGLLRQYFPKKTDLSGYSQADLNKVALQLNQRPRKALGFETPASKLQASVAPTS
jgi:IS30 family transposase